MYFGYYPGAPKVRMSQKGQRWKYVQSALTSESPALPLYNLSFTRVFDSLPAYGFRFVEF